jgi:hypothetical protein
MIKPKNWLNILDLPLVLTILEPGTFREHDAPTEPMPGLYNLYRSPDGGAVTEPMTALRWRWHKAFRPPFTKRERAHREKGTTRGSGTRKQGIAG